MHVARSRRGSASWVATLAAADAALTAYGRHRLEPLGWRDLGIGSLTSSGIGFRYFALEPATDWATYELEDRYGQTVADLIRRQRGALPPELSRAAAALGRSRLAPYRVESHTGARAVLRSLVDGTQLAVNGCVRGHTVLPAGAVVVARVVRDGAFTAVLGSFALPEHVADQLVADHRLDSAALSRASLQRIVAQVADLDMLERASVLEPMLVGYSLADAARLDRALQALEHSLRSARVAVLRRALPHGELVAERVGAGWRVSVRGRVFAAVERIAVDVAHPFDVEVMRQVGAHGYVLEAVGPVDQLARACATVAVAASRRAA